MIIQGLKLTGAAFRRFVVYWFFERPRQLSLGVRRGVIGFNNGGGSEHEKASD